MCIASRCGFLVNKNPGERALRASFIGVYTWIPCPNRLYRSTEDENPSHCIFLFQRPWIISRSSVRNKPVKLWKSYRSLILFPREKLGRPADLHMLLNADPEEPEIAVEGKKSENSHIINLFWKSIEMSTTPKSDSVHIREVWAENLEEEFDLIREIVDDYPLIAMDTEFPGIVLRPVGNFKSSREYHYQTLKSNVDILKLIQLGLTFSDEDGKLPDCGTGKYCVWQFNFREFNIRDDVYASDSIELLRQSGMDFEKNKEKGIDAHRFGELLMSSGIVLNENVQWITFHSGYDFGYLLKLLTNQSLPPCQADFFSLIRLYFPNLYDIKHLMKFCNSLHGGLNRLADLLHVQRIGACHQAGSDSLLTSCTFRKLREGFFNGATDKYAGVLYGLGVENNSNASNNNRAH